MDLDTNILIKEFSETFMPEGFKWRKGQKEAIYTIIDAYKNGTKVVIVDAPVGSGKSIIGIASAWILNQYNKSGYILASDISLQEQYEKDIKSFKMRWGSVKGIDNYKCIDNMEKNSLGTCRIRNKPPKSMHCYESCPYFSARDFASNSQTTLLNYAYWLIMQNYVNDKSDAEYQLFKARDFTICDEGHKILNIVQNHYSPRFDDKLLEKLEKLTYFFDTYKIHDYTSTFQNIKINVGILKNQENQNALFKLLEKIEISLEDYFSSIDKFKEQVNKEYPKENPPKEWREALRICDWLKDFHCKLEDYVEIISLTSTDNLIKNPSNNDITFNCLEESYMMNKYFHKHTGFTVIMSATFADPSNYLRSIAINKAKYIKMESTFDFTKSPIYFYNKRRMSYNHIDANLPWLCEKINEILDSHDGENGIIHSASYHLTMKIHDQLSPKNKKRILIYEGTTEKRKVLEILKQDRSKVLMGPSLLEGLDLKNEYSRFQIFAKVPYLSLADKFVKAKLAINPIWYKQSAIIQILQGIGRSIRSEDDWATTYFLDAGLADLIHKNRKSFPIEFMQRIQIRE